MAYVITRSCCNDATCVSVCPVNCIHPTPDEPGYATAEMLYIDPQSCIDCGACVDVCPVSAIHPDFELEASDERYLEINQRYFDIHTSAAPPARPTPVVQVQQRGPLRVAIVGSGPAGCYAAEALLNRKPLDVEVTLFERLPTPWGLVRYGVAPDHQVTKAVDRHFHTTASRAGLTMHLNVDIGTHLSHEELLDHHHAVIYASGAAHDRRLDILGEHLPGSYSATAFVGWYNGHPEYADHTFDLGSERAVIVGNGNVALDVARILTAPIDTLAGTDIAGHALEALAASSLTDVVVLGRRGGAQAAFTTPELLGLLDSPGVDVLVEDPLDALADPGPADDPMAAVKVEILREIAARGPNGGAKRIWLRFLTSPLEVLGDTRVRRLRVGHNELTAEATAMPTGDSSVLDCGMVLRSVGYRATPLPGLPFDPLTARIPQDRGRVSPGVYTAGWLKRGPSGGIGTNKWCAAETVDSLIADYAAGRLVEPRCSAAALTELIDARQPEALRYTDWRCIDSHERAGGGPRRKLTSVADMLGVARGLQEALR